jgi:hypothetical protein
MALESPINVCQAIIDAGHNKYAAGGKSYKDLDFIQAIKGFA